MDASIGAKLVALMLVACSRSSLPTPSPPPARALMFGGSPAITASPLADTWQWDGSTWTMLDNGNGPSPRVGATMGSLDGRVVLFGGENANHQTLGDTWEWDGAWHEMTVPGPPARSFAAMATLGNVVVMSGGTSTGTDTLVDTWLWDGAKWTALDGQSPDVAVFGLATLGGVVVTLPTDGSVWTFDGHAWSQINDRLMFVPFPGPMTSTSTTLVIFGAYGVTLGDTWVWTSAGWEQRVVNGPTARRAAAMSAW